MRHVKLEQWSRRDSPLHRRDARAKVVALLIYLVTLAFSPLDFAPAFALLWLLGVLATHLPISGLLWRTSAVLPMSLSFALLSWFAGDAEKALTLLVKSWLSGAAALLLTVSTPLPLLLAALESLGLPIFLVSVLQFLYRYLFVLTEQAGRMRQAAQCRGGRTRPWQAASGALGVLFGRSLQRAEGIHQAMMARGYQGSLPIGERPRLATADYALMGGMLAAATVLLALRSVKGHS